MLDRIRRTVRALGSTWNRGFWALMALAHAPGFFGAWKSFLGGGFDGQFLGGCIGLSLAMIFFAAKFQRVHCLRFRADFRSWVAVALAVTLLHADLLPLGPGGKVVPATVAILATTLLATGIDPVRRFLGTVKTHVSSVAKHRSPLTAGREHALLNPLAPHWVVLATRLYPLRAPPF